MYLDCGHSVNMQQPTLDAVMRMSRYPGVWLWSASFTKLSIICIIIIIVIIRNVFKPTPTHESCRMLFVVSVTWLHYNRSGFSISDEDITKPIASYTQRALLAAGYNASLPAITVHLINLLPTLLRLLSVVTKCLLYLSTVGGLWHGTADWELQIGFWTLRTPHHHHQQQQQLQQQRQWHQFTSSGREQSQPVSLGQSWSVVSDVVRRHQTLH